MVKGQVLALLESRDLQAQRSLMPYCARLSHRAPAPRGAYKFPAATSCRICFSSESSATSRFSLAFSCSSALMSRLT